MIFVSDFVIVNDLLMLLLMLMKSSLTAASLLHIILRVIEFSFRNQSEPLF